MNCQQKGILAVFLPLTLLIVLLDNLLPGAETVLYVKEAVVFALLFTALKTKKRYQEQVFLTLALCCAALGDFCLVLGRSLQVLGPYREFYGALFFLLAYFTLILIMRQSKTGPGQDAFWAALPVLGVMLPAYVNLYSCFDGQMLCGVTIFGLVLCYLAWAAITTFFRGYYSSKASLLFALAGYLMFLSDLSVAFATFHPHFANRFVPWLSNLIWATYIPAWTMIALVIAADRLYY